MIDFLYTNIGRGHPYYLDGIVEELGKKSCNLINTSDVFEISKGLSLTAWKLARKLYKIGSTDSIIGKWYNRFRDSSEYDKAGLAMKIMGREIEKKYSNDDSPLVAAHPVLVGMLNGRNNLFYQHGEIAVPKQAVVKGANYVFVPTEQCLPPFLLGGYKKEQMIVTGLCIEPTLCMQAEEAYENRINRIRNNKQLTGAFFSSGAEPKPHVQKIIAAAVMVAQCGEKAIVFAVENGKIHKLLSKILNELNITDSLTLCTYNSRSDLNKLTAEHFHLFDYFVSPSHERTNWALGLGLPMFILDPAIGPFAPLNRIALLDSGVAVCLENVQSASALPELLLILRDSGGLVKMAESGWRRFPVHGFEMIADFLVNKFPLNS